MLLIFTANVVRVVMFSVVTEDGDVEDEKHIRQLATGLCR